jgi:N-sulfoglucosamine sulfohydrolase
MRNLLISLFVLFLESLTFAADRPNILWITLEDMSPTLGCYGDSYANTPNMNEFSKTAVLYTNAFATAPVCSPSRACLINGLPASIQGTQNMRSAFPLPDAMRGFPALLKELGYYTSNNVKTDYNSANFNKIINASWDVVNSKADWRGRKDGQAFFSVINLMESHQSRTMVWPYEQFVKDIQSKLNPEQVHNPSKLTLPPYYPDSEVMRRSLARYYDCVTYTDQLVGGILQKLADDGLKDDTIVFIYSDHGSGMPRHKRVLLDTGMNIPLLIHFPKKYEHLLPKNVSMKTDRLVNFEDFGPTVLNLLGIPLAEYMTGKPFLGKESEVEKEFLFGHRDRVDEALETARSVRSKKYLYIRNFIPCLSYNQPSAYSDLGEIRQEIYKLSDKRIMSAAQWHYAGPSKGAEELYDCQKDPLNLNNLAHDPQSLGVLEEYRGILKNHLKTAKDLGFVPELEMWNLLKAGGNMWELARQKDLGLSAAVDAAFMVGSGTEEDFLNNVNSPNASVRYWGVIGLRALSSNSNLAMEKLKNLLSDSSEAVRLAAANALSSKFISAEADKVLKEALVSKNLTMVLYATRYIQLLPGNGRFLKEMNDLGERLKSVGKIDPTVVQSGDGDLMMFIDFSQNAYMAQQKNWLDLFNGKNLDGWINDAGTQAQAEVKDGEINMLSVKTNFWLRHEGVYGDFELEATALMPKDGYNSGLGFRCVPSSKKITGYQCEIDAMKTGSVYAIGQGWVYPEKDAWKAFEATVGKAYVSSEWNHFYVKCQGNRIEIRVNGTLVTDIENSKFKQGFVMLQHHGKGDVHKFKNIRIRPLK